MILELDNNERVALVSALENYLNGVGMDDVDEDESVLEIIMQRAEML